VHLDPNAGGLYQIPWNKGRLIGQKRPLKPKEVWAIRVRLQLERRSRNLALFNLAIDSKLRGCDLVRLRVNDVCVGGQVRDRATVIQQKTGRPLQFEITEQTRAADPRLVSQCPAWERAAAFFDRDVTALAVGPEGALAQRPPDKVRASRLSHGLALRKSDWQKDPYAEGAPGRLGARWP
jgi:hypothetical protein